MIIIDVYSRFVVDYHIGLHCTGKDLAFTLNKAYAGNKVVHELIPLATPNKNAHVESFNSILEIEFMQPRYFWSYEQAYSETVDFIKFYNNERIHGSLNDNTPNEMLTLAKEGKELNIENVRA